MEDVVMSIACLHAHQAGPGLHTHGCVVGSELRVHLSDRVCVNYVNIHWTLAVGMHCVYVSLSMVALLFASGDIPRRSGFAPNFLSGTHGRHPGASGALGCVWQKCHLIG